MTLSRRDDGAVEALCSRCLCSELADSDAKLVERYWELRADGQTWCPDCSRTARTPKGRPNARGVVRRRR